MREYQRAPKQWDVSRRGTRPPSKRPGQPTFLLIALLLGCLPMQAQQVGRGEPGLSGFALENFNRVAASAAQHAAAPLN